jgi:Galactose binding lectin domain
MIMARISGVYGGDYCDTEVFRAECSDGEVIIMQKALYGRLKIGRCVEIDLGYIGCYTDVLTAADRRCSGKRVCEIRVPDAEFESTRPCLKELKTYLEASYQCVPGKRCDRSLCEVVTQHDVITADAVYSSRYRFR